MKSVLSRRCVSATLLVALLLVGCAEEPESTPSAGFAGLGETTGDFAQARPGTPLRFPADHGPHPDYRIEWWYLTANLEDETGDPLGVQWTLFRQALSSPTEASPQEVAPNPRPEPAPWVADQLWMAHIAVSQGDSHRVAERFARGHSTHEAGQAGVQTAPFRAWLDDWMLASAGEAPESDPFQRLALTAHQDSSRGGIGFDLTLDAEGPLVLHGENGFSQKTADGQGSMYYSQPFYRVTGEVTLDGETRAVAGQGWLDREWSSQLLDERQQGWDWFSLHLASGHKLMAAQVRGGGDGGSDYRAGTWIAPDGTATPLTADDIDLEPLDTATIAARELPIRWRLVLPAEGLDLVVEAPHAERWMATSVPYWEGEVAVRDRESGEERGRGYLEMTGY